MKQIKLLSLLFLALLVVGAGCAEPMTEESPTPENETEPNVTMENENSMEETDTSITVNESAGIQVTCPDGWSCSEHQFDLITAQKDGAVAAFTVNDTANVEAEHSAHVQKELNPRTATQTATLLAEGDAAVPGGTYALIQVESTTGRKEIVMVVTKPSTGGPSITCTGSYDIADQEEVARDMKALCESVDTAQ